MTLCDQTVLDELRRQGGHVLLSFSRGKDSLVSWLALRRAEIQVIPFYMYHVPGLGFVERTLEYYERFFDCPIIRVPHPALYRMLANCIFQPPERVVTIDACEFIPFTPDELIGWIKEDERLPKETWTAIGLRAADTVARRTRFLKHGPLNYGRRVCYPTWHLRKDELITALLDAGVKTAPDYRVFGHSFDGPMYRYLPGIKANWPEDYAKILEYYPLAELELLRWRLADGNA